MWIGASGYPRQVKVKGKARGKGYGATIRYSRYNDPAIQNVPLK